MIRMTELRGDGRWGVKGMVTMIIPGYGQGRPVTNWLHWNNRDKVWEETNGDPITEKVTAWKPIPEAYEEENEGSD